MFQVWSFFSHVAIEVYEKGLSSRVLISTGRSYKDGIWSSGRRYQNTAGFYYM